ncbi:Zn-dependent alcohol dehydrogenase [Hoeflea poritis]|nr:Zn-dependent alcohol dehydrogenase [Hoeflea poritis]
MKAAVLNEPQTQLIVEDVEIDAPMDNEVLVKTAYCGVCHSDVSRVDTPKDDYAGPPMHGPTVLGHEAAGVVIEVGAKVTDVKVGDHVVACNSSFCGKCEFCLTGRTNLCINKPNRTLEQPPRIRRGDQRLYQQAGIGGYAEFMLMHENSVTTIRDDMPLDRASLIGCGVITGMGAVFNRAKVFPGAKVAVFGLGGIGMSALQGSFIAGALQIIAVDINSARLQQATAFGATDVVNAKEVNSVDSVKQLSGGGVDFAFEATGSEFVAADAFHCLKDGGTAIMLGVAKKGAKVAVDAAQLRREKVLTGSSMGSNHFKLDIPQYIEFYRQGRLKLDEMVTREFALVDINEAFDLLRNGDGMRSVIKM